MSLTLFGRVSPPEWRSTKTSASAAPHGTTGPARKAQFVPLLHFRSVRAVALSPLFRSPVIHSVSDAAGSSDAAGHGE